LSFTESQARATNVAHDIQRLFKFHPYLPDFGLFLFFLFPTGRDRNGSPARAATIFCGCSGATGGSPRCGLTKKEAARAGYSG